ncbi:MAG: RNA polymerase sigma factor [Planctomycetia bacterium]
MAGEQEDDQTRVELLSAVQKYLLRRGSQKVGDETPDEVQAWIEFYETYNRILRRFAHKIGFVPAEADDLLQEVWVNVVDQLGEFDYTQSKGRLRSWLYAIIKRRAVDFWRRRKDVFPITDALSADLADERSVDPYDEMERRFYHEALRVAMDEVQLVVLPVDWQCFQWVRIEKKTSAALAAKLGILDGAVRQKAKRVADLVRKRGRELIGEDNLPPDSDPASGR